MRETTRRKRIMQKQNEKIGWSATWRIDRFRDSADKIANALQSGMVLPFAQTQFKGAFIGTETFHSNIALNEGLGELIDLICGLGSPTKWDNSHAYLGVGDTNTATEATQTGLQASTNKTYKQMDTNYPQRTNQTVEWRATFGSQDANYAWEEYTVANTSDESGKNLNRKVASKGTKVSGETWTLSLQITFS
jgi:hypothetical protein